MASVRRDGPFHLRQAGTSCKNTPETKECDVVVAGLGIAGVAAFHAAAEGGMDVIAIEKSSIPNCRSQGIAGFNSELTRKLGVPEVDPMEIANEPMTQMAHRADYRIVTKWLKHSGEALDWYLDAYDGLMLVGPDDDFGKSITKMHPIATAPFKAITYDSSKHTSVDDVSCLRLLVTMGGLMTNDNAQVLDDNSNPIGGLYAVGNTQGGRFVEDYPFTLSGASHAAALTYGYLAGHHIAENA